jgi:N-acylneuraminate cytidylyltransferase
LVPPEYCIDIDSLLDWECAEVRMQTERVLYVRPGRHESAGAGLDFVPALVVFDFDGVFTDNCVLVGSAGEEYVRCNRSDGFGVASLRAQDVPAIVLSSEQNPVVGARCSKLRIDYIQGVRDKPAALKQIAATRGILLSAVLYVGNDMNDAECMELVGMSIAVNDAHPEVKRRASRVLARCGGQGAIQEVAEMIARTKEGNRSCQDQLQSALGT